MRKVCAKESMRAKKSSQVKYGTRVLALVKNVSGISVKVTAKYEQGMSKV